MPIMRPSDPIFRPNNDNVAVTPTPSSVLTTTVNSEFKKQNTLATYLQGYSRKVDYYAQVKAIDDQLGAQDIHLSAVYQSYRRIKGFELKVTGADDQSQNPDTNEMVVTGSANVYYIVIPNVGDMFIADIGDGRAGVFTVTDVKKKSIYANTSHVIEYRLIAYNSATYQSDLDKKVIEDYYFDLDSFRTNGSPLLTEESLTLKEDLESHYERILQTYFNDFYSLENNTFLIPDQEEYSYDPFIIRYIFNTISSDEHILMRSLERPNVEMDTTTYEFMLWYALEHLDIKRLPLCAHRIKLISTKRFFSLPVFNSIYFTKIKRVLVPKSKSTNVDKEAFNQMDYLDTGTMYYPGDPQDYSLSDSKSRRVELDRLSQNSTTPLNLAESVVQTDDVALVDIKPVVVDDYYVFSSNFYHQNGTMSKLEALVIMALKGQPINTVALMELCDQVFSWSNLDRFYYSPILLHLIRIYKRVI